MNLRAEEHFHPNESFVETSSPTTPPNLGIASCGCLTARNNSGADSEAHDNGGDGAGFIDRRFVAINRACDESNDSHLQAHGSVALMPGHQAHNARQVSTPRPELGLGLGQNTIDDLNDWLLDQAVSNRLFVLSFNLRCDIGQPYQTLSSTSIEDQGEEYPQRPRSPTDSTAVTGYGRESQGSVSNTRPSSRGGDPRYTDEPLQVGSWVESAPKSSLPSGYETFSLTDEEWDW
ncbi:hypothetical protein GP486_005074 [Trichoglossum hirsutum]|uniref:Uncharacterized protein n=1 Tax=Trichoglossum hirsutum TaxID=265104 RepID=A0A9P8L9R4_9PEZI|nr:hypothetical protein GP486_005074 [Trichoglossum hirsutum]